jgi:protein-arginine kinase activator protein McsA|tara:strand:+ start:452 stop:799 length:348 start_codon:yes stop_codon:yes gene_type:complete
MKWKATEFTVESTEAFEEMIASKDFRISSAIVDGIFANLKSKKKHIHLLSVIVEGENSIFDITIDKKHFAETLEENLPHYVREERYEDCQRIADEINKLKKSNISDIINQVQTKK